MKRRKAEPRPKTAAELLGTLLCRRCGRDGAENRWFHLYGKCSSQDAARLEVDCPVCGEEFKSLESIRARVKVRDQETGKLETEIRWHDRLYRWPGPRVYAHKIEHFRRGDTPATFNKGGQHGEENGG